MLCLIHVIVYINKKMSTQSVVDVCILTADETAVHVTRLAELFSSPYFNVIFVTIIPFAGLSNTKDATIGQTINSQRIIDALNTVKGDKPSIIIKDSSISSSSPDVVESTIRTIVELDKEWDVAYLTSWLDRCDLYANPKRVDNLSNSVVDTVSPNGTQALMFSVIGRRRVMGLADLRGGGKFLPLDRSIDSALNLAVEKKNLFAVTTVPNLFEFDTLLVTSISDLAKLSNCRTPEISKNKGILPFTWFILIVLGAILVVWALANIGPKENKGHARQTATR